jgi:hypothetical protein
VQSNNPHTSLLIAKGYLDFYDYDRAIEEFNKVLVSEINDIEI